MQSAVSPKFSFPLRLCYKTYHFKEMQAAVLERDQRIDTRKKFAEPQQPSNTAATKQGGLPLLFKQLKQLCSICCPLESFERSSSSFSLSCVCSINMMTTCPLFDNIRFDISDAMAHSATLSHLDCVVAHYRLSNYTSVQNCILVFLILISCFSFSI